jgi:hypothetical protein
MKILTSDDQTIEFDASRSKVLMDICEGVPIRLSFHSDILAKLQNRALDEPWETLCDMMNAADFLYMPDMLDSLGQRMADMLRGKSAEQVRKMMSML